jgi:VWFA-related protein
MVWAQAPVTLNLVVKDRRGAPVRTLTTGQFEVSDEGTVQKDVRVRMFDGSDVVEGGERKPAEEARRLKLVVLAFEEFGNEQRLNAKHFAQDLFKESKDPNHRFAVVMLSNQMSLLQPFTADRKLLEAAVDLATSGALNPRFVEVSRTHTAALDAAAAGSDPVESLLAKAQLRMVADRSSIDSTQAPRRTIAFLNSISNGLALVPGRKAVAHITWGLIVPQFLDPPFLGLQARANRNGVSFYCVNALALNAGTNAESMNAALRAAAIGPGDGLENTVTDNFFGLDAANDALRTNTRSHIRVLSESTGGILVTDTNDPRRVFREMLSDLDTYYEISYTPAVADYNGAFRKTSVRVDARDARVRDRAGYFALPPEMAADPDVLPFELPLMKALGASPLPKDLTFASGALKVEPGTTVKASAMLEVPLSEISFKTSGELYAARMAMLIRVKNASGEVVRKFSRDLPLQGKTVQLDALKASRFTFREEFEVPPGRYTIEAIVADAASGKKGARRTAFVAAARPAGVAMSAIAVVRSFVPAPPKAPVPDDPYQFQGGRITPALAATLVKSKGAQMALFFTVYPDKAAAEPVKAAVQYLKDGALAGQANLDLPVPDQQGRIPYVLSSPMETMPAGAYEIRVTVQQGTTAARESAFVTIEEPVQ